MARAALEHARGTDANAVRAIYRKGAEQWEQIIPAMDFRPRVYDDDLGDSPRSAKELKEAYGAKVIKTGREYYVSYKTIPRPLQTEVLQQALVCAAISGDAALARRLASGYKLRPRDPEFDVFYVLRHLLAGDDREAADLAKRLRPAYPADWPPELIEFPLGVVREDRQRTANSQHAI